MGNPRKYYADHLLEMQNRFTTKKITVDGHGGHMCEAFFDGDYAVGHTIEEAVGLLVIKNQKHFNTEVNVLPCQTSAYDRSYPISRRTLHTNRSSVS